MRRVLLFLLLLAFVSTASATEYYLATTGNDGNTGLSIPQAWLTIAHADGQLSASDTLWVVDGTYANSGTATFDTTNDGTLGNLVTLRAYNGTPIFDGASALIDGISIDGTNNYQAGYIKFDGLTFRNFERIVDVRYTNNITFDGCTMYNSATSSNIATVFGSNDFTWTNCIIHNYCGYNGLEIQGYRPGASVKNFTNRATVSNSNFYGNAAHAMLQIDEATNDTVIYNCSFWNNTGSGGAVSFYKHDDNAEPSRDFWMHNCDINSSALSLQVIETEGGIIENITIRNALSYPLDMLGRDQADVQTINDLLLRNITITNPTDYSYMTGGSNIVFDSISFQPVTYDIRVQSRTLLAPNVTFRDTANSPFKLFLVYDSNATIEYTDGTVHIWQLIGGDYNVSTPVRYYPTKSNCSVGRDTTTYATIYVTKYNITLIPTNSYLMDVVVNHESDALDDRTNITVNSSVATNPTWINATMQNATHNYSVSVDTVIVNNITSDSEGVVSYQYSSSWSTHTFEFDWVSSGAENQIVLYANEYALVNNWTTEQTFQQIATNISNDIGYSYYNSTSGLWDAYRVGQTYNQGIKIPENCSVFVFVNTETTMSTAVNAGGITITQDTWFYGYLPGAASKTLTEIETAMDADGLDVWGLYGWDNSSQAYTATGGYSVDQNEGYSVYCNVTGEFTP